MNDLLEAAARVASAVDVVHFESRAALHAAWSDAAEAGRRAAALERRLEETFSLRFPNAFLSFHLVLRWRRQHSSSIDLRSLEDCAASA